MRMSGWPGLLRSAVQCGTTQLKSALHRYMCTGTTQLRSALHRYMCTGTTQQQRIPYLPTLSSHSKTRIPARLLNVRKSWANRQSTKFLSIYKQNFWTNQIYSSPHRVISHRLQMIITLIKGGLGNPGLNCLWVQHCFVKNKPTCILLHFAQMARPSEWLSLRLQSD